MSAEDSATDRPEVPEGLWAALSDELQSLALIHRREADDELIELLGSVSFPCNLSLNLSTREAATGAEMLEKALRELPSPLLPVQRDELAADYACIYLTYTYRASPYESVWLTEEQLTQQEPMFEVRKSYEAHGLAVPDWRITADDHLSFQLEFLSRLLAGQPRPALGEAAEFMDAHLLRWVGEFSERVAARCGTPFYAGAALLTAGYCDLLRDLFAVVLDDPRPSPEEIEARYGKHRDPDEGIPLTYVPGVKPSW